MNRSLTGLFAIIVSLAGCYPSASGQEPDGGYEGSTPSGDDASQTGGGTDAGGPANPVGPPDAGGTGGSDAATPPHPPIDAGSEAGSHDSGTTPPVDASPPPVDSGGSDDASSGGPTATWTYLYPTYFEGATTSQTPGHCSPSCHNHSSDGENSATSSTLVQKAYKDSDLTLQGGGMPQDNSWTDATALALIQQWAAAGYPQ